LLLGPLANQVVGATVRGPRFESIRGWRYANKACDTYRILDDDANEFPVPAPAELILCDPCSGVSAERVLSQLQSWLEDGLINTR